MLKMSNDWPFYSEHLVLNEEYHLIQGTSGDSQKLIIAYCRRHSIYYDPIDDCVAVKCSDCKWRELTEWLNDKDIDCFI